MAKIILVDDQVGEREDKLKALQAAGHDVVPFFSDRVIGIQAPLEHMLNSCPKDIVWDVFVLDLQFGPEMRAGMDLYNRLRDGNYLRFWQHTIVFSKHVPGRPDDAKVGEGMVVTLWAKTAGIPLENLINSCSGGRDKLLTRIKELVG